MEQFLESEHYYPLLIYCSLGIETLGSFLDNKPLRARQQSKIRFGNALYQLFPNQYGFCNKKSFLYDALRNHSAHNLIPSPHLSIYPQQKDFKHLSIVEEKTIFCIDIFTQDFLSACKTVKSNISNHIYKAKHIPIHSFN